MTDPYRRNPEDIALADGHEEAQQGEQDIVGHCEKCGKASSALTHRAWSATFGTYYEGKGICAECRRELYEDLWRQDGIIVSGSLSAGVPEGDGDYTVWPRMERKIDRIREEGLG